jgi:hypothetical protein
MTPRAQETKPTAGALRASNIARTRGNSIEIRFSRGVEDRQSTEKTERWTVTAAATADATLERRVLTADGSVLQRQIFRVFGEICG